MDWGNLIVGFVLGVFASVVAALCWDGMTRPKLSVVVDLTPAPGNGYRWYNVKFLNIGSKPFGPDPRPAWGCKATLSILSADAEKVLMQPIPARWTSTPEPLTRLLVGDQIMALVDPEKIQAGKRIDIHSHEEQLMPIVLKHHGDQQCYLFNNESYYYPPRNVDPNCALPIGKHRLRITVYYERGYDLFDFCVHNFGTGKDDVLITSLSLESIKI